MLFVAAVAQAESWQIHSFERIQLTDRYYSEGINAADIDGDGQVDVIHGPFWFAGPEFKSKKLIYQAPPQNREGYANNFFSWPYDFNKDGLVDVLTAGFPGTPAFVHQNPGKEGHDAPWPKHQVFDWVSNESPHFTNLVGDAVPELVCSRDGYFGYVEINPANGLEPWNFHPISERIAPERFGHGLGVGDVNGDGRLDVLMKDGWFEQPEDLTQGLWTLHKAVFAQRGGAEMFAYDVDGDGDNDVITGKTYWSHHKKSHGWNDGAVVYWFKLVRGKDGIDWLPMKADGESGIGRQLIVKDVNGDRLPDLLAGGMKGAHVLIHRVKNVSEAEWQAAQPKRLEVAESSPVKGPAAPIDEATGRVPGALEGEFLAVTAKTSGGAAKTQNMKNFTGSRWSGDSQLFWSGGKVGDTLGIELSAPQKASYRLELVLTCAPDFAIVQPAFDGRPLGAPVDLYQFAKVGTTGVLQHDVGELAAGLHKLTLKITGTNPNAVQNRYAGLDYVRLVRAP